jgi:hypothetical protein
MSIKIKTDIPFDDPDAINESKLDLIEKGHKLISMGAAKLKMNQIKDAPSWKSSSFSIENTIPSGEKPSSLSSFAIVPPRKTLTQQQQ